MCKDHQPKQRPGATLNNPEAHAQDHQTWSRRDFLSATGMLGAGGMLLNNLGLRVFQPSPLMAALAVGGGGADDRIVVLIRLDGGNDSLNMVVERGNTHYYDIRPTLAIPDNQLWYLSNEYGMPAYTNALQPLWENGMMKVVFNVGYPEPNYSHFRSYDIIASASDSETIVNTGWMGRFLNNEYSAFLEAPPTVPPALQIGVQTDLIFKADQANMALAISSPEEFYQIAQNGQLYKTAGLGNTPHEQELLYVRQTANSAFRYASTIQTAFGKGKNAVTYPSDNYLAEQLAIVARLIKGNLGTRVYMVQIGGFDTHSEQAEYHPTLLSNLANAIKAFYDDLEQESPELTKQVLGMTFSEFGRTIFENGSNGTDHGWGTHMMLFGGELGNGFVGNYQDLSNPDPYSDPPFSVDFRSVYATVLQDWLGNSPDMVNYVLGQQHPLINNLVPAIAPDLGENNRCALLGHNRHPNLPQTIEIKYAMSSGGPIKLQLLDKAGHVLRTLVDDYRNKGSYTFNFIAPQWFVGPGTYQYRLMSGGQVFQREIRI